MLCQVAECLFLSMYNAVVRSPSKWALSRPPAGYSAHKCSEAPRALCISRCHFLLLTIDSAQDLVWLASPRSGFFHSSFKTEQWLKSTVLAKVHKCHFLFSTKLFLETFSLEFQHPAVADVKSTKYINSNHELTTKKESTESKIFPFNKPRELL